MLLRLGGLVEAFLTDPGINTEWASGLAIRERLGLKQELHVALTDEFRLEFCVHVRNIALGAAAAALAAERSGGGELAQGHLIG